jgi:predicted phosphohydrolase
MATLRIAVMADLHGHLPEVPACDLLLLAGDICPLDDHSPPFQAAWLDTEFRAWLQKVPARQVAGVAGNHDFVFERAAGLVPAGLRWQYLQDTGFTFDGVRVWGSPWQPPFGDWAFNAREDKRQMAWGRIPTGTDILLLHGPPYGHGDLAPARFGGGMERAGCYHLLQRIDELPRLRLAAFGHIHGGRGVYRRGQALLANASVRDERYGIAGLA